jgi:hypothetical protein
MQHATFAARSFGVMLQAALAAYIILKYLHATEQHFHTAQSAGVQLG